MGSPTGLQWCACFGLLLINEFFHISPGIVPHTMGSYSQLWRASWPQVHYLITHLAAANADTLNAYNRKWLYTFIFLHVWRFVCCKRCALRVCVWMSKKSCQMSILSFHHLDPGCKPQVFRLAINAFNHWSFPITLISIPWINIT